MPVFSYIAHPVRGEKETLSQQLNKLDHCEAISAENEEIIILVTDTPDQETEEKLQKKLNNLKSLQGLSMTFGHTDDEN